VARTSFKTSQLAKEMAGFRATNLHFGALDKKNNVGATCKNPGLFEEQHNSSKIPRFCTRHKNYHSVLPKTTWEKSQN
jgi:hypothetical protein